MKRWKRVLAAFLSFLMVVTIMPALDIMDSPVKTANAAAPAAYFSADDFGLCYTKVLLQQVGKAYGSAGGSASGYTVGGTFYYDAAMRVTSGTPYSPLTVNSTTLDCHGLVITCLMAMGYDKFTDTKGHEYPLNAYYGGSIFDGQSSYSIFKYNGTGDVITLHHSNDQTYTLKFKLGKVTNKSDLQEVNPGTLLFNLAEGATIPKDGQFSAGWMPTITHSAVALFYLKRADSIDGKRINDGIYSTADINAALTASYDNAYAALKKICTDADASSNKNLKGFLDVFNSVFATPTYSHNGHTVPKLWDARSRGFWGREATTTNYKVGFTDGHASVGFGTPYDPVWQIESIGNGVCINNNPYGKTASIQLGVYMEPTHESGTVTITKKDDKSGTALTGAGFDLYEWSTSKGQFVKSTLYHIAENPEKAGEYVVFDSSNQRRNIEFTSENAKTIKVVETKAPVGYDGGWSAEHTFTGDGEVVSWEVPATNKLLPVGFTLVKKGNNNVALPNAVFTLYSNEACTGKVSDYKTNTDGKATIEVTPGTSAVTYYLKETTAPTGYELSTDVYRITVNPSTNKKETDTSITIAKKAAGSSSYTTVTSITIANALKKSSELSVTDQVRPVGFTVVKKDNNNVLLPNATFTVYTNEACTGQYGTYTTNTSGKAPIEFKPTNDAQTFYMKETTAPTGYVLSKDMYKIVVNGASNPSIQLYKKADGESTYTSITTITAENAWEESYELGIRNDVRVIGFSLIKKGSNNVLLPNATFTLYDNEACTGTGKNYTTNTSGKAELEFKPTGSTQTFYLKETSAPTGYLLSKDLYKIVINSASNPSILLYKKAEGASTYTGITTIAAENAWAKSYELGVNDEVRTVGFSLIKKGSNNTVLPNATFTLYTNEACTSQQGTYTTNTSGKASIDFTPGNSTQTFYLKETKAPTGYLLSNDVYKIVVNALPNPSILLYKKAEGATDYTGITTIAVENAWAKSYELGVLNTPVSVGFEIVKTGYQDVKLKDAEFEVYRNEACTDLFKKYTTDENGKASIEFRANDGTQTFYLKETAAPDGYALSKDMYKIVVNSTSNSSILLYKKAEGATDYTGITTITAENARAENYDLTVPNQPTKVRIQKVAK